MADVKELERHPSSRYSASPLEDNMFEWHFTIRGPTGTDFEGGLYHGRILLPADYPFKPPNIVFMNENGRFEVGTKICLSISAHHEETWQPAWGIRTMLEAIISFFPSPGAGAIGALEWPQEERLKCAKASHAFTCQVCGTLSTLLPDSIDGGEETSADVASQVAQLTLGAARDDNAVKIASLDDKEMPHCAESESGKHQYLCKCSQESNDLDKESSKELREEVREHQEIRVNNAYTSPLTSSRSMQHVDIGQQSPVSAIGSPGRFAQAPSRPESVQRARTISESFQNPVVAAAIAAADSRGGHLETSVNLGAQAATAGAQAATAGAQTVETRQVAREPELTQNDTSVNAVSDNQEAPKVGDFIDTMLTLAMLLLGGTAFALFSVQLVRILEENQDPKIDF